MTLHREWTNLFRSLYKIGALKFIGRPSGSLDSSSVLYFRRTGDLATRAQRDGRRTRRGMIYHRDAENTEFRRGLND